MKKQSHLAFSVQDGIVFNFKKILAGLFTEEVLFYQCFKFVVIAIT